ncbi:MAG TPA: alpha/beta hydrolase [Iamia sp.]
MADCAAMSHPGIDAIRSLLGPRTTERQTIQERRDSLEALAGAVPSPDGVTVEVLTVAGRPAERSIPDRVDGAGTILYLHGGAYVSGSLNTHRALSGRLALAAARPVVALDYRLGPEHPFPAAVDDAVAAAVELAASGEPLAVAGDSAGGGLALATLVALRDRGDVTPVAGWLISPWADLTQSGATYDSRIDVDPMLARETLTDAAGDYLGAGDPTDPLASPMMADLSGLPAVRIDVGDAEVLLDDSVVTGHRIEEAGGAAQVLVWPEMIHVFPAFPADLVPEADECLTAAGAFLAQHLAEAGAASPNTEVVS